MVTSVRLLGSGVGGEQIVSMAEQHMQKYGRGHRVPFTDAFSAEFVSIMDAYARLVAHAIESSDLVIFVARKALCLYYALQANGKVVPNGTCAMTSSRALDRMRAFPSDYRVTIIDDVMVHGRSIRPFVKRALELGAMPRILVAGASVEIEGSRIRKEDDETGNLAPLILVRELETDQVYRLSREMVGYVNASGVSNNVDQPLFDVPDAALLMREDPQWLDLTPAHIEAFGLMTALIASRFSCIQSR